MGVALTLTVGFGDSGIHLWPILLRSSSLLLRPHCTWEAAATHTTLPMAGERVHTSKGASTEADIVLHAHVDLGVPLEIVLANEPLVADIADELAVAKMGLDMCADVLTTAKPRMATAWIKAPPLVADRVLLADVL